MARLRSDEDVFTIEDTEPEGQIDDGAALPEEVVSFVRRFVVLSDAQAHAVALWTVHSHALDAAEATPYLSVTSAEKRSGKTRLLEVLALLVAKPWLTGRVTAAVLARKVDAEQPTLLLDESDAAFGAEKEYAEILRGLLNSGYTRSGKASVCVGQGASMTYKDLSTFCPKAIAGIGKLPDTVTDRAIPIRLERRAPDEPVERFRRRDVEPEAETLRRRLAAFAKANEKTLLLARPGLPDELSDRAADVWEPLFAIADLVGGEWPERARRAALILSAGQEPDEDSIGVRLLGDCRRVFEEHGSDRISTADLIGGLAADEEAPWGDWKDKGKIITPRVLARLLHNYRIRSAKTVRLDDGRTAKGYKRENFERAFARYLRPDPSHPSQRLNHAGLSAVSIGHKEGNVTDGEEGANPHEQRVVTAVTDTGGGKGEAVSPEWLGTASLAELREHYGDDVDEGAG